MAKYICLIFLLAACATAEIPEEARDADGVGGATAKVEAAKWLGQVILQAITNTTINIKVDHGTTDKGNSDKPSPK